MALFHFSLWPVWNAVIHTWSLPCHIIVHLPRVHPRSDLRATPSGSAVAELWSVARPCLAVPCSDAVCSAVRPPVR